RLRARPRRGDGRRRQQGDGGVNEPAKRGIFDRVGATLSAHAEGVLLPVGTVVLAFVVGGLAVLAAGHNPISAYNAIFKGTGLNYVLPWTSSTDKIFAAINLQQTLIETTPLILTALRGVRVPLRHVQHRRPGPVLRRVDLLAL